MTERRALLNTIIAWEQRLTLARRCVLALTLWMTWRSFEWAGIYAAQTAATNGMEAAAVIAAVTAPICYLQAAVFKAYIESKST